MFYSAGEAIMMKKIFLLNAFLILFNAIAFANVSVVGTFNYADGTPISGTLSLQLTKSARDSCNSNRVVPTTAVIVKITNGVLGALSLPTSDCLSPFSAYYVRLQDQNHQLIFQDNWLISSTNPTGTLAELAYLAPMTFLPQSPIQVSVPKAVLAGPTLSQVITQPSGTYFGISGGPLELQKIGSAPPLSIANEARLYTDGTNLLASINGGAYFQIANSGGGALTGSGTGGYISKWSSASVLTNSLIQDNGTSEFIGTDPGGADLLRVGGTERALRLGLGAAADAAIPFLVQSTNSTGAGIFTTGATNNVIGLNFENSRGSGFIGVFKSASNPLTGAIDGAFVVAGGPDLTGFGSSQLQLGTNGAVRATIDSSGKISINHATYSDTQFNVTGVDQLSTSVALRIEDSSGNAILKVTNNGSVTFNEVGPHAIGGAPLSYYGWQWIGTFSPGNVSGASGVAYFQTINASNTGSTYGFNIIPTIQVPASGSGLAYSGISAGLSFLSGTGTAANIQVVDVSSFVAPTGTTNAAGIRAAAPTGSGLSNADAAKFLKSDGSTIIAQFQGNGSVNFPNLTNSNTGDYVCWNAGILEFNTVACSLSDETKKNIIGPYDVDALALIAKAEPLNFFYKEGYGDNLPDKSMPKQQIGFSAQRMVKIVPDLVPIDSDGVYSFDYVKWGSVVLTRGMQQLIEEINVLKTEVADLKAKVN
jgi:hypothetical protein